MAMLGISTNTRLLGMAIIDEGRLVEYKIHLHKSPWSAAKADTIVTTLEPCVQQYCITSIVLSIPHAHHQTSAFVELIAHLTQYFEGKGIPVYTQSAEAIYALCPKGQKKTKKTLMKTLTDKFPHLIYCHQKELRNKNRYYIKIFEAVASATLQSEQT